MRTVSLDQFCQDHSIDYVDLLKLDVQGHEHSALKGSGTFDPGRSYRNDLYGTQLGYKSRSPMCGHRVDSAPRASRLSVLETRQASELGEGGRLVVQSE